MNTDSVDKNAIFTPGTHLDLLTLVDRMMASHGHPNPQVWRQSIEADAFTTQDANLQRFFINRQLRMMFSGVTEEDTIQTRQYLIDDGEIERWVEFLDHQVIPAIIRLGLPRKKAYMS